MGVVMQVTGDPSAEPAMLAVVAPATVGLALVTVRLLRSYVNGTSDGQAVAGSHPPKWRIGVAQP